MSQQLTAQIVQAHFIAIYVVFMGALIYGLFFKDRFKPK